MRNATDSRYIALDDFFASGDILTKYKSLNKYTLVFALREMIRQKLAKSPVDALRKLDAESVNITNLFTQESEEISTDNEEENKEAPKI